MEYVADVDVPLTLNAAGAQVMEAGVAAEPEGVRVITAVEAQQTAWATVPNNNGAGVMLALITRSMGAQEPGGFIYKVYCPEILVV
jgi:hypothetical protein